MKLFFEHIIRNADEIFLWLLLVSSLVSAIFSIVDIFKSRELKILKLTKDATNTVHSLWSLMGSVGAITNRSFLNHIVNNGHNPDDLATEIVLDDTLLSSSSAYMKVR